VKSSGCGTIEQPLTIARIPAPTEIAWPPSFPCSRSTSFCSPAPSALAHLRAPLQRNDRRMPGAKSHFRRGASARAGSRRCGMHRRNRHHRERVSDGQLDLVAEGRNRFEIVGVNQERSFLQAEVLMIVDEPGAAPQEDTSRAVQFALRTASHCRRQTRSLRRRPCVAFFLSGRLSALDLDFKQKLLSLRSEAERLSLLITYLQTLIPNLHRAARAREKSRRQRTRAVGGALRAPGFGFRAPGFGQEPNLS